MAGGTKRMSADEKRKVILDIYHKTKSVYTEKEILTLASKAGVNANTVADINQSLVDDGLVDKEKIGGSNYYWSFPAKQDREKQLKYEKTLQEIERLKGAVNDAEVALMDAKRGREDDDDNNNDADDTKEETKTSEEGGENVTDENKDDEDEATKEPKPKKAKTMSRAEKLQRLEQISKETKAIEAELEVLKENDPQALADLQKELQLVTQAAHRWTDNIFQCKDFLTKKRGMDKKEACKILGITSAFDYPEDKIPK